MKIMMLVKYLKPMPDVTKINKIIREIRKENRDEGKILRDLGFLLDPEKNHYQPKKTVSLSIREYIDIRPYLSDIINNHKTQGE